MWRPLSGYQNDHGNISDTVTKHESVMQELHRRVEMFDPIDSFNPALWNFVNVLMYDAAIGVWLWH
jgi:hypothetical protein